MLLYVKLYMYVGVEVYVHIYKHECGGESTNLGVFHQMMFTFPTGIFSSISEMSYCLHNRSILKGVPLLFVEVSLVIP